MEIVVSRKLEGMADLVSLFKEIGYELKFVNRFSLPSHLSQFVKTYIDYNIKNNSEIIAKNENFYRARIEHIDQEKVFESKEMGAPPLGMASSGRINPDGISYLYIADSIETAISEVRPWKGAKISVAKLSANKQLKIVNLIKTEEKWSDISNTNLGTDCFVASLINSLYFSSPSHSKDKYAYIASQYISEMFKAQGVQGIKYKSSLHEGGINTALFDINSVEFLEVNRYVIGGIKYNFSEVS